MIKNRPENTIKDIPAWWRPVDTTSTASPFFAVPACIFSEGRYLSYLLFLKQNKIDTKRLIKLSQLVGTQNKLQTTANIIEKKNPNPIQQLFSFGEKTALVLTGELAGTIASPKTGLSFGNTASRECLRPIVPHIYPQDY